MKVTKVVCCMLFALVLTMVPALAQFPGPAQDQGEEIAEYGVVDLNRPDQFSGGEPTPPELPAPLGPAVGRFELVGTTSQLMSANAGVLNFTLACQQDYAGSRVCSVSEVNRTVNVPAFTVETYAWVLPDVETPSSFQLNCNGWMSIKAAELGLAVVVGPTSDCSGGLVGQSCASQLSVACCAGG